MWKFAVNKNMAKVSVYNLEGKKIEELELSDLVFGLPKNNELVHQAYVAIASNKRQVIAHTKDRGEVSGSGIKPWRQKGTGTSRVGSSRNPLWVKGGVVFGPNKEKNFKKKINQKMNQKAILIALSDKVRDNKLTVVDGIKLKNKKTKEFAGALQSLKLAGSILLGFSEQEKELRLYSRNIEKVNNILTRNLNVFDILNRKNLILSKDSIKFLEEKYGK